MFRNADGFVPPAMCPASPPNGHKHGSVQAELFLETGSQRFREVLGLLDRAAECDVPVVFHGEIGVGKRALARLVHQRHARHAKPFVVVGCHGATEDSLARQLFGSKQSSPSETGLGSVEAAAGGTLLLVDIGDAPIGVQTSLLRLLHERRIARVGESRLRHVNVRLLATTRGDLDALVAAGRFDPDLFFRLNVIQIDLLPLRQRVDDILPLARHFLGCVAPAHSAALSAEAESALVKHDWPGNIAELRNALEHASAVRTSDSIQLADLPEHVHVRHTGLPECGGDFTLEEIERRHVLELLSRNRPLDEIARTLGIDISTLWRKRKKYGAP
jgi:NtrC-family two-component system response regulator AlgB